MKKTFAALALIIGLVPVQAFAQSSVVSQIVGDSAATEKLYFSLKLGLNVAYLQGAATGADRTGNFNAGLTATIRLSERLSLTPEITLLSRKGISNIPFEMTGDPALDPYFTDPESSALALKYTDIPVLIKYRFGRIHVGAGPLVAFLSSASERFRAELESGEELRFKRAVTDRYKKRDFGLVVEASWTITKPRRGTGLVFHVRYQAGMTDVLKVPSDAGPLRNSAVQAYVSFPFVR